MEVGRMWVSLGLNRSEYDRGISSVRSQGSSLGGFLKNSFSFAVGQGMFDAIKTGLKAAWDTSIGFNADLQQNQIAFETMLGSGQKAKTFLEGLQKFAAQTPFEFRDLTDASKKLLAFGFEAEKIPTMLKSIGDASAGLGMSGAEGLGRIGIALGQISAKGKVQAGEMLQLTEAGIPAWDILAKAMGKSTAEVMKLSQKGLLPAKDAIDMLITGMETRFPNMMEKQSKSFKGLMSTLKDNIQMTLGKVTKNAFEGLTSAIDGLVQKTSAFSDAFQNGGMKEALKTILPQEVVTRLVAFGSWISGTFVPLIKNTGINLMRVGKEFFPSIGVAIVAVAPIIRTLVESGLKILNVALAWIADHGTIVKAAILGIVSAFVAWKSITTAILVINAVKMALAGIGPIISFAQMAIGGFSAAIGFIVSPIGIAIIVIGALAAAAYLIYKNWGPVKAFFINLWNQIKNVFVSSWKFIKSHMGTIVPAVIGVILGPIGALVGYIATHWNQIKQRTSSTWKSIKSSLSSIANSIKQSLSSTWSSIKSTVTSTWNGIKSTISNAMSSVWSRISSIGSRIKSALSGMFKFNIPHIKLPHFSVSGKLSINPPSIPKLGVNWYDKGGIFNKPSIIGVNFTSPAVEKLAA